MDVNTIVTAVANDAVMNIGRCLVAVDIAAIAVAPIFDRTVGQLAEVVVGRIVETDAVPIARRLGRLVGREDNWLIPFADRR